MDIHEQEEKIFSPLNLPKKKVSVAGGEGYKVYKSATEFEAVEAATVSEAIEKSGIDDPFKVVRANADVHGVLNKDELQVIEEVAEEESSNTETVETQEESE